MVLGKIYANVKMLPSLAKGDLMMKINDLNFSVWQLKYAVEQLVLTKLLNAILAIALTKISIKDRLE